jgi:(2Fe-2S) ferredoxin
LAARKFRILVCRGPECGERRGSASIRSAFDVALTERPPADVEVEIGWQSCFGRCTQGPNVLVQAVAEPRPGERQFLLATMPRGRGGRSALYNHVTPPDAVEIVEQHIASDRPVSRLIEPPARSALGYNASASSGAAAAPRKPPDPGSSGTQGDS